MADPIIGDAAFQDAVSSKMEQILDKLTKLVAGEAPELSPEEERGRNPSPTPEKEEYREKAAECSRIVHECWDFVAQLQDASAEAAKAEYDNMAVVSRTLDKQSGNELGTALEDIRRLEVTWHDSQAAVNFKAYLNGLENALEYQRQFAASLHGLMHLHRELILGAREGVLDVLDKALKALDVVVEERQTEEENKRRQVWSAAIDTAFAIAGGAITGGPAGAAAGAVAAIGREIGKRVTDNSDPTDPKEIVYAMKDSIIELRRNIRHEEDLLAEGFDELIKWPANELIGPDLVGVS